MFNHLHQRIILDIIRKRSIKKYRIEDVCEACLNYFKL